MVVVKVSETYDLSTVPNKMGVIGIHTPDASLIQRNYPGLLMNCKKIRYLSCDVALACASMLPVDPLGVGLESGDIAPQDMFNPIMYKAVSNVSMSQVEYRLAGLINAEGNDVHGASLIENSASFMSEDVDNWNVYYGLLSNRHGWKVAMPQEGLTMSGLKPLVHERLYAYGQNGVSGLHQDDITALTGRSDGGNSAEITFPTNYSMYGNAKPMPAFNTTAITPTTINDNPTPLYQDDGNTPMPFLPSVGQETGRDGKASKSSQPSMPYIPPIYVACIVMPPAKLQQLYYRIRVDWSIEFTEIRPITEIMDWYSLQQFGGTVYFTDYATTKSLSTTTNTVDTTQVNINKVM